MKKIDYLEGLRGIAAFIVLIFHYILVFYPHILSFRIPEGHESFFRSVASQTPLTLFFNGNFAVCIFFVLSGYVLSYKFFKTKDYEVLRSYALKRYIRLVVPAFFSIAVAYIFMKFSLFHVQKPEGIQMDIWVLSNYWNFDPSFISMIKIGLIETFSLKVTSYNPVLWTMFFEFFGSMLVFGTLGMFYRYKSRYIIYAFMAVFLCQTYFLGFILGMILCDLFNEKEKFIKTFENKFFILLLFITGIVLACYPTVIGDTDGTFYNYLNFNFIRSPIAFYHTLGAFFLITAILYSSFLRKILSFKFFLFLGKISFSLYLIHLIILSSICISIYIELIKYFGTFTSFCIASIISVSITVIASWLMQKYIDTNGILLAQKFYDKFFKNKTEKEI